jgi:hypothetical protein
MNLDRRTDKPNKVVVDNRLLDPSRIFTVTKTLNPQSTRGRRQAFGML